LNAKKRKSCKAKTYFLELLSLHHHDLFTTQGGGVKTGLEKKEKEPTWNTTFQKKKKGDIMN
jgi:hypothetical protein